MEKEKVNLSDLNNLLNLSDEDKKIIVMVYYYRFLSENLCEYIDNIEMEKRNLHFKYAESDNKFCDDNIQDILDSKKYYISPDLLFRNLFKKIEEKSNKEKLIKAIESIVNSAKIIEENDIQKDILYIFNNYKELIGNIADSRLDKIIHIVYDTDFCMLGNRLEIENMDEILKKYNYTYLLSRKYINRSNNTNDEITKEEFDRLIEEGEKHLGKKYIFGANGPDNFDCSSYVCYVFNKANVRKMVRCDAWEIYNFYADPILPREAKKGDIVVFHTTYETDRPITHIGIYVGEGKMLHTGHPTQYSMLSEEHHRKHFYGFARVKSKEYIENFDISNFVDYKDWKKENIEKIKRS